MTPPVVALAGLSGVGKSTLLARLKNTVPMQILQASALIKEARMSTDGEAITLDALRAVDLDENQLLLAEGFARRVDLAARLIVLDCHVVIETPDRLVRIDPRVYSAMEVRVFLYLEDEPEEIARRRKNDTTRQRPVTATENIGLVQVEAIRHARAIAAALNIPLYIHRPAGEEDAITKLLRSYQAPGGT
jgi:adenylate kinase